MSKSVTPADKPAGTTKRTANDLPAVIGVDCRGALHRYDPVTGDLVVTDSENNIVEEREMDRDELAEAWIPHVGRDRGWIDCWFDAQNYTDVVGRLGRALKAADATEADA